MSTAVSPEVFVQATLIAVEGSSMPTQKPAPVAVCQPPGDSPSR